MRKKTTRKINSTRSIKKKTRYLDIYLVIYSLLFFVSISAFSATKFFITSHTTNCANTKSCTSDLSLNIENNVPGMFEGKMVQPPTISSGNENTKNVLGTAISGEKHIFVDLSTQTLTAYQGTTQIMKTLVSTGKWNPTPTGNFHIWEKLLATRMAGGEGADAYDLPNVPYVMYFYNDFGLHGAYWHDNFGHQMSHGCVNMRQVDAKALFAWADGPNGNNSGTEVSICDRITSDNQCIQDNPVQ